MPTTKPKPKLDPAVEAFYNQLIEKASLSDAEIDLVHTLLGNEKIATEFKSGVHARRLTDKERDDLAKEKKRQETEYTKKLNELDSLQRTLSATSNTETKKSASLEKAIEDMKSSLTDRETKLRKLYETVSTYEGGSKVLAEAGLTSLDLTTPVQVHQPPVKEPSQPVSALTVEDVLKVLNPQLQSAQTLLARLPFDLAKFGREYKSLTGKELDVDDFYNKIAAEGTGDYNKVYLKEYDIENLREQQIVANLRATIEKEYNDKLELEISKRLTPSIADRTSTSAFSQAIASTIPETAKTSTSNNGVSDRASLIAEAVQDFAKQQRASTS